MSIWLRIITTSLLVLSFVSTRAQDVVTYFNSSAKVSGDGETASMYSVRLTDDYTFVTIELIPTRNRHRMNYFTSGYTRLEFAGYTLRYKGALSSDGKSVHTCEPDDQWGWSNVKKGESYRYTLVFEGRVPHGCTTISVIDDYRPYHGYSFRNYVIKNPDPVEKTGLTEYVIKKQAEEKNDGIVGIYEEVPSGYRLGCIKSGDKYKIVYLGGKTDFSWWRSGDLKAILTETSDRGIYSARWYLATKDIADQAYIAFDGSSMHTLIMGEEATYAKVFPDNSVPVYKGEWTGSGFAINNGYIVTNHHVVDGASKIVVVRTDNSRKQEFIAKTVALDKANDLAIIHVEGVNWSLPYSVKLTVSDIGETCFALGYPLTQAMGTDIKLTTGIISSKTGFQGDVSSYQVSVPIQPGNSGGPLFNEKGEVIGIINAKLGNAENVSYAIKTSYLSSMIDSFTSEKLLPSRNTLSGKTLPSQVLEISPFVFYIKCE